MTFVTFCWDIYQDICVWHCMHSYSSLVLISISQFLITVTKYPRQLTYQKERVILAMVFGDVSPWSLVPDALGKVAVHYGRESSAGSCSDHFGWEAETGRAGSPVIELCLYEHTSARLCHASVAQS